MIQELSAVVRRYPACHAAHSALANRSLQLFNLKQEASDNPMPASQIFGAAAASQFRSSADLRAWLDRAVGPNSQWLDRAHVHARAAVRLAPLEGEPYAVLAEVCFLAGEGLPVRLESPAMQQWWSHPAAADGYRSHLGCLVHPRFCWLPVGYR